MVDLGQTYWVGVNNLIKWRSRYSEREYPGKVVLNIFYRRYTMEAMWPEMIAYISNNRGTSFVEAVKDLEYMYSITAATKIVSVLESRLTNEPERGVGNITYSDFKKKIALAAAGDRKMKEDLEYSYLYFRLSDEAVKYWAAARTTGLSDDEAIKTVTNFNVESGGITSYSNIVGIMGRLAAAPYLSNHYVALP